MIPFPFFREFNVLSIENLKIIVNFGPLQRMSRMTKHVSKAGKVNPHQDNHFTRVTLSPCKQAFNNNAKAPPKRILREFDVSRIGPRLGGLPHLERLHSKIWPRVRRLPGLADRATRLGGSPHLSCKRDQIKMRVYRGRRVTSPT